MTLGGPRLSACPVRRHLLARAIVHCRCLTANEWEWTHISSPKNEGQSRQSILAECSELETQTVAHDLVC